MPQRHHQRSSGIRKQTNKLKNRKRKLCENETDIGKFAKREQPENSSAVISNVIKPLEDVTSSLNVEKDLISSHNVEQELELEIIKDTRAITPEIVPSIWRRFRTLTCYASPHSGTVPLPGLTWADRSEVWDLMCKKDKIYVRDPEHLRRHPLIDSRMRAILLDWLTEVCEVYKLHRETYYLAVDYMDRYFTLSKDLPKVQLQLTGITCLFIASKIEEIYPPKLSDFSYVTDEACSEEVILEKELAIVKLLKWDLNPITTISWLNTYLQLLHNLVSNTTEPKPVTEDNVSESEDFVYPHYSGLTFVQVARLLDLCTLDINSLRFPTSKLAASALCYLTTPQIGSKVSGYTSEELRTCCDWMSAFAFTVQEMASVELKTFDQVSSDDLHNIQTHSFSLDALEIAQQRVSKYESWRQSPAKTHDAPPDVLTPPKSDEKCFTV